MFLVVSSAAFVSQSSLQMRRKMSNESQSKLFGFFDDLMKGTPMGKKQEPTEMPVPSQSNLREVDGDGDDKDNIIVIGRHAVSYYAKRRGVSRVLSTFQLSL